MIKITPKDIEGSIEIVSSKSLSHRYVIAASLALGKSKIENILDSDDLVATKNALEALGAKIDESIIQGSKIKKVHDIIDAHESGSTLRFLIPIAMLQDEPIQFIGKGKLPERPLNVYQDLFENTYHYKYLSNKELPLEVKGPLKSGVYKLPGNVSSQFITGLLYALPLVQGDSKIILTTPLESRGYVDLTLQVLRQFGIKIEELENGFSIKGSQTYQPGNYYVEGDYSGAAFFVAAGLIGKPLLLKGLNPDSLQGDKTIIDIAKQMGGKLEFTNEGLMVYPSNLKGVEIDLSQIPDLGPILMVLACYAEGKTLIKNAERLRIKESDRLEAMVENLTKMGAKMTVINDSVLIEGKCFLNGDVTLKTFGDHRIAMASAIAGMHAKNPIYLDDEKVVSKSYPTFFKEYVRLGGLVEWIK
ncbi:3-phosphoshikimate 1-carboxyvinyltransferase [Acholeplasma equifetale]|uniref:3-phosphoshikimate 1-carboxyvinyltransferase n=1 Tax=Acholeplasma equifetale TaxID=264634 RepID=UPI00055626AF|nr:3-phosphoshikimate 1-carboxyvinyltransferase [Acholeplasma equifetale]